MKRGFTLIELLIVIGILAILATTVVLVLNPAQILAESRDTQRISDLSSVQSAIGLMLATDPTIPTFAVGPRCHDGALPACVTATICGGFAGACTATTSRAVDGFGWLGIDLNGTAGGSALSNLPADPTTNATYHYAYKGDDTMKTYELNGRLESTKLRTNMQNDGGDDSTCSGLFVDATCWYEIGTDPGLNL